MPSTPPSDETCVTLVGGPRPKAFTCVSLPLRVGQVEFPANIMPDRAILIPEWVPRPTRMAAATFAVKFERGHRIVIHELLKCAQESIRVVALASASGAIRTPPTLSRSRELIFRIALDDEELILHVSCQLTPCQLHVDQDVHCDVEHLFAAYDIALEYMQAHLSEIEALGFDATVLRMSMRDWHGYRERLRLV